MDIKSYSNSIKNFFSDLNSDKKSSGSSISISNIASKPKTILIIFPINQDFFRVASYAYRNLPYSKSSIEFHYLINDNFIDFFSLRKGYIHNMNFDNKLKILNKDILLDKLNKIKFDVTIDLNINYESNIEDFITNQQSNYKIGFKHKKSDSLYNVQLDISKTEIAEKGYQQILKLI
tara:strand:- start:1077 stop:1607 length:531 start_codon:yes stop_codon:yes gene_type:complete